MQTVITQAEIRAALRETGLAGRPLCVHSSLSSFGCVAGGAGTVVGALLAEDCTLLVPTFSFDAYTAWPPAFPPIRRNGLLGQTAALQSAEPRAGYTVTSTEIDRNMGAIPAYVLQMPGHHRGDHPLCSFTSVGLDAAMLVAGQTPVQVYAPFEALAHMGGAFLMMGVGLNRLTALHFAEKLAGRALFVRWAVIGCGDIIETETGGCSEGFGRLEPGLAHVITRTMVGQSLWRSAPADHLLSAATEIIRREPEITRCADPDCLRCPDSIAGGPIRG